MRLVIQRVSSASVTVNDKVIASIQKGMLILVGFEAADYHGWNGENMR
jgi:D-tyrosyl-tRNA(Tyr) deacylase